MPQVRSSHALREKHHLPDAGAKYSRAHNHFRRHISQVVRISDVELGIGFFGPPSHGRRGRDRRIDARSYGTSVPMALRRRS